MLDYNCPWCRNKILIEVFRKIVFHQAHTHEIRESYTSWLMTHLKIWKMIALPTEASPKGLLCEKFYPFDVSFLTYLLSIERNCCRQPVWNFGCVWVWMTEVLKDENVTMPIKLLIYHTCMNVAIILKASLLNILLNVLYFRQLFCVVHNIWRVFFGG